MEVSGSTEPPVNKGGTKPVGKPPFSPVYKPPPIAKESMVWPTAAAQPKLQWDDAIGEPSLISDLLGKLRDSEGVDLV